jgi:hypothetical protein
LLSTGLLPPRQCPLSGEAVPHRSQVSPGIRVYKDRVLGPNVPSSPALTHPHTRVSILPIQAFPVHICMPQGKRVHFVDPATNTVVYPDMLNPPVIPSTPSPTFSLSSLSSSPLPSTPGSFHSYHLPLPSPGIYGIVQRVHPAISYNGRTAPLHFDVTVAPSQLADPVLQYPGMGRWAYKSSPPSAQRSPLTGRSVSPVRFELALLDEPVTYPHRTTIVLFSDLLPWSTRVEAETPGDVVTIFDVLQTLHTALRTPISKFEWNGLSVYTQNSVSAAFYHRLGGIRDHSSREKQLKKGVRRLDFLLGNTKLLGIAAVPDKPDAFTLCWGSAA